MRVRLALLAATFFAVIGVGGYLLGPMLQAPDEFSAGAAPGPQITQGAPVLLTPANGSEFVDSDITLHWSWAEELPAKQRYALRIWTGDKPYQEIWTVDNSASAQRTIDSFSVDFADYLWQVAVVNVDADGVFQSMGSEWSQVSTLRRLRRERIPAKPFDDMSSTAKHFFNLDLPAGELIDAVQLFVHDHSLAREQLSYAPDYSDAVELMYNYSQGDATEQPQLQCDGRSTAMLTILQELGIESRLVFLYSPAPGWLAQHTVLEVFHPEIQRWQAHDLAWDFYYVEAASMERVSAERILFGARGNLLGCPITGGACSADVMRESAAYFAALRYGFTFDVWVNPDRFDLSARFEGQDGKNLAEFIGDGDPRRVTIRMDNWHLP